MSHVAYYRVSTQQQGRSGLGLEAQQKMVRDFCREPILMEFIEVESGRKDDRPQLAAALAYAKANDATLTIAKLDRLARDNAFVANLIKTRVPILVVDQPHASVPLLQMMSVFAEMEAKAISERTKAALAAAKARGVKLGGCSNEHRARINQRDAQLATVLAEIRASGAENPSAIARALNARGVPTARGGQWQCVQVQRLLARCDAVTGGQERVKE